MYCRFNIAGNLSNFVIFWLGFTEFAFNFCFYQAAVLFWFVFQNHLAKLLYLPEIHPNIVRHRHKRDRHVQIMTLNHLFWSQKTYTGLRLVLCSPWHCLKHGIFLSSILYMTFQISPVVPAKAQISLACIVITSDDKSVCFQFKSA